MISKSIHILPILQAKEEKPFKLTDFAYSILSKTPQLKSSTSKTSLFFKKRKKVQSLHYHSHKDEKRVYVDNRSFYQDITPIPVLFSYFTKHEKNQDVKNMFFMKRSKQEVLSYSHKHGYKSSFEQNHMNAYVNLSSESTLTHFTNNKLSFDQTQKNEAFFFKTNKPLSNQRVESVSNLYQPQSLHYKVQESTNTKASVPKVDEGSEAPRDARFFKNVHHTEKLSNHERIERTKEIAFVSEKVYNLVIKKYDKERRRRGDLYV